MNDYPGEVDEVTDLVKKGEDTSIYMKELRDYQKGKGACEEQGDAREEPQDSDRDFTQKVESHPQFWFIWEQVPGPGGVGFLHRLRALIGQDWVVNGEIEKAADGNSMVVSEADNLVYFEVHQDVGALILSDRAGKPFIELTARKLDGLTYCFLTILCNRKLPRGPVCMNAAVPGTARCPAHTFKEGYPAGQRRLEVTSVTTGSRCLPVDAYYFWKRKKPEIARFIDELAESFRLKLNWDVSNPLMDELRYIAVQIVTRNLMHNKAIEADFKSAIYDPVTKEVVAFKAHFLLDKVATFDARIQQKLKDFGLLIPPSRTEDTHRIPIELEFLWTPMKRVKSVDTEAKVVDAEVEEEKEEADCR